MVSLGLNASQKYKASWFCGDRKGGDLIARIPGRQTLGASKPLGRLSFSGMVVGSVLRTGPAAANTTLDPRFKPLPL